MRKLSVWYYLTHILLAAIMIMGLLFGMWCIEMSYNSIQGEIGSDALINYTVWGMVSIVMSYAIFAYLLGEFGKKRRRK